MTDLNSTLVEDAAAELARLTTANQAFVRRYPGDRADRQPVHTVYGGAHLFSAQTAVRLGELAIANFDKYAPDPVVFAQALGLKGAESLGSAAELAKSYAANPTKLRDENPNAWLAACVHERVRQKVLREPVEDFRIDFEDGFGVRPDPEEDAAAVKCAHELAQALKVGTAPPYFGIRIKPLNDEMMRRSIRTLDLFVTTLVKAHGNVPETFVVTLPKIQVPEQVSTLVRLFERLEKKLEIASGSLKMEFMIELTQSIMDPSGRSMLPDLLSAASGRCVGAHFGTYDYTASFNVTAALQTMDHPACDFALMMMKLAYAGTGIFLSDGATNVMPVGPHKPGPDGKLTPEQEAANARVVHAAWKLAFGHITRSLKLGYYQGWDLHPAQLPVRYAACYAFFLEGFAAASERLRNFVEKAAQATLVGDVFDDAATGQGLLNYFLRGLNSGAVSLAELSVTGLTEDEIRTRSFVKILAMRTARKG